MIDYSLILKNLPSELHSPLLQLIGAVEQNLREQLARHEDVIDVRALANGLAEAQQASDRRMEQLGVVLQQLAQAEQRTEFRIEQLGVVLQQLGQAQQRTEVRIEQLTEAQQRTEVRIEQLTEAQQRTEVRIEQLTEAQQRTERRVEQLVDAQQRTEQGINKLSQEVGELTKSVRSMQPRLAKADGWQLEQRYVERAPSYFGRWLRQINVLWPGQINRKLEEQLDEHLNFDEKDEVLRLDAILRGKTQQPAAQAEIYVALEASVTVNMNDVERVTERAALLRRIGVRVAAVVAGEMIERDADEYAQANGVAILQNGTRRGWEQALAVA